MTEGTQNANGYISYIGTLTQTICKITIWAFFKEAFSEFSVTVTGPSHVGASLNMTAT